MNTPDATWQHLFELFEQLADLSADDRARELDASHRLERR